jgi:hypothetical protein
MFKMPATSQPNQHRINLKCQQQFNHDNVITVLLMKFHNISYSLPCLCAPYNLLDKSGTLW